MQVSASVAAAASEDQQMPNGALMNGTVSHEHDISTESSHTCPEASAGPYSGHRCACQCGGSCPGCCGALGELALLQPPCSLRVPLSCIGTWLPWHLAELVRTPFHRCRVHATNDMYELMEHCGHTVHITLHSLNIDTTRGCKGQQNSSPP